MPCIEVAYCHSSFTGQPEGLKPADVGHVAQRTRIQLCDERLRRCLPVDAVAERLAEVEVNGLRFEASWDLDHPVINAAGKPVMGVTEYDNASPRCVMVSVNGPMLANAETLLRSTIAHEIGHVVFDAPGWILVPPAAPVSSSFNASPRRGIRANFAPTSSWAHCSSAVIAAGRLAAESQASAAAVLAAAIDRDLRRARL